MEFQLYCLIVRHAAKGKIDIQKRQRDNKLMTEKKTNSMLIYINFFEMIDSLEPIFLNGCEFRMVDVRLREHEMNLD